MQVGVTVNAEVNLTALDVCNSLCNIHGHGTGLGVRHQVTGTQDLTQAADLAHHVGGCNRCVEVGPAASDLCDQLVGTNVVSASCLSLSSLGACCDNDHASGLTGAVGQVHGTANHLVCLTGVNGQTHCNLNGCVGLGGRGFLRQGNCLSGGVELTLFNLGYSCLVRLAALCHLLFSLCSCGLVSRARLCHIPSLDGHLQVLCRKIYGADHSAIRRTEITRR